MPVPAFSISISADDRSSCLSAHGGGAQVAGPDSIAFAALAQTNPADHESSLEYADPPYSVPIQVSLAESQASTCFPRPITDFCDACGMHYPQG